VVAMRTESGLLYPYFEFGRIEYIIDKVAEKGQSPDNRNKILPMVALIGDIKESITDGIKEATIPILFMVETRPETPNPTRYTTTFVTLYDLMNAFNLELGKSPYINMTYPDFTKLDSAYYSGVTNKINVYTDVLVCEYKIELIDSTECDYEEPTSFSLVVSAGTGGTTEPAPATYTMEKGEAKAFYAAVSAGYRFVQWLHDGAAQLLNPIAIVAMNNGTLIAQFIKQWLVTTSVDGEGTITPSSGLKDEGNITITVTPTNPLTHEFEKIEITPDGEAMQTVTTNPYTWALNKAVVIVGYIKAMLDNFTITVTKTGNGTIVPDVGEYVYQEGTVQTFTATETDPDYYLDANYLNGVPTTNPLNLQISMDATVEARFLAYQNIADWFSAIPVEKASGFYYQDLSGINNNTYKINFLAYGNSITKGTFGGYAPTPYPALLDALLPADDVVTNLGFDGQTSLWLRDNYRVYIEPNVNKTEGFLNVMLSWDIGNAIAAGYTVQQVYDSTVNLFTYARANKIITIAATASKHTPTVHTTNIEAVNALIRANWATWADYFLDINAIPEWQDPAVFTGDGVHPNNYTPLAEDVYAIVQTINRTYGNDLKVTNSQVAVFPKASIYASNLQQYLTGATNLIMEAHFKTGSDITTAQSICGELFSGNNAIWIQSGNINMGLKNTTPVQRNRAVAAAINPLVSSNSFSNSSKYGDFSPVIDCIL